MTQLQTPGGRDVAHQVANGSSRTRRPPPSRLLRRRCRTSPVAPGARSTQRSCSPGGRAWEHVIPFFAFPPEVRRIVYTANMIESLHMQLRKIIENRGHFPSDEAAIKLLWLALRNINDGKARSAREWKMAMNQFAVLYGDRFVSHAS